MSRLPARPAERGIILIVVLLAVAIMSVMVVAATALTRAGIGSEQLEQRRLASHFALRSALEQAKATILATPPEQRVLFDGGPTVLNLGDGISATVRIRDAAGLADLNRSDPGLIEAVAGFYGLGKSRADGLAQKILKLRKEAAPQQAVGTSKPTAASPPQQPAGTAPQPGAAAAQGREAPPPVIFLAVDQFYPVLGLAPEDGIDLSEGLTVYNPTGMINPLAAPSQVLQSVPGIAPGDIADIEAVRKRRGGARDARLQPLMQRLLGLLSLEEPSVFVVEVRLDGGPGLLGGSKAKAVIRLTPQGRLPFGTLALEED